MLIFIFHNRIVMCVDPVLDRIILSFGCEQETWRGMFSELKCLGTNK